VSFDYLAKLKKFKKKTFFEEWAGVMKSEKPNQGYGREKGLGYTALLNYISIHE
jgi:hypothetical protein